MITEPIILFEDDDLAVVSKPPGLVVNRSETVKESTLQDWWAEKLPKKFTADWEKLVPADFPHEYGSPEKIFQERGGVVHRLDKETSGVLLLAKNPGALANLLRQFRLRETHKMYTCLVHGKFHILEDTVQLPLARSSANRTKFAVAADGRVAETTYKVMEFFPQLLVNKDDPRFRQARQKMARSYQGFSLVQCWPKTGRTHQIRVHMAHLKHPIVSDGTYLGKKRAALDVLWCPRLFLHATELDFTHPRSGAPLHFTAPLWGDLMEVLKFFKTI